MTTRIAVLGGGVMGETLLSAIRQAKPDAELIVAEKDSARAEHLKTTLGVGVADLAQAVVGADVVVVAVKPQDVVAVADSVGPLAGGTLLISVAAGVTTSTLQSLFGAETAVVRVMPNTPAVIGRGVFGVSPGESVTADQRHLTRELLSAGGEVVEVDEVDQDALTAVSGSGPAYVFYLAESMIAAGIEQGLAPDIARTLTIETISGAAELMRTADSEPEELRRRVTSPNGTTFAATQAFDAAGVAQGIRQGIAAATDRSRALG